MKSFGELIRELRFDQKFSLRAVAVALKMNREFLRNIEHGKRNASRGQVLTFTSFYQRELDAMLVVPGYQTGLFLKAWLVGSNAS